MRASVDEIAARAGISKGAVYRHFDSKASLYVTVLAENSSVWQASFEKRIRASEGLSSAERIRDIWSFYLDHWLEFPDHFRIFWAIDNEDVIGELPKGLAERVPEYWRDSLKLSQRLLDEGVERGEFIEIDTWLTIQTFWTVANALIEQDGTKGRRRIRGRPLKEIYDHAIELILRGILTDPSRSTLPGK